VVVLLLRVEVPVIEVVEVVENVMVLVPVVLVEVIVSLVVDMIMFVESVAVNVDATVGECSLTTMANITVVVADAVVGVPVKPASLVPVALSPARRGH